MPIRVTLVVAALALVIVIGIAPAGKQRTEAAGCYPVRPHASGTSVESITSGGVARSYRLHVPPSYSGSARLPLVLNFHGIGATASEQEYYSGFSSAADTMNGGFFAVYPEGLPNKFGLRYWNVAGDAAQQDDVGFVDDIIDELSAELCLDSNRVFATGMSNGAMMSVRLACSLSARIAAVAPVAGAYYPPGFATAVGEICPDTRPVPLLTIHGTADQSVPFNGGAGSGGVSYRLPIDNDGPEDDVLQSWAAHNGCPGARQTYDYSASLRIVTYTPCPNDAIVQLYQINGGPHTWPKGGTDPIDATTTAWWFFLAHPMPSYATVDSDHDAIPDISDVDNDNDGCPDANELSADQRHGGQRNPKNPYDYFNPTHDGKNRMDDVLLVLGQYFEDRYLFTPPGQPLLLNPDYRADTDRTLVGPSTWNVGPGDGQQRLDDVQAILGQYPHDCP